MVNLNGLLTDQVPRRPEDVRQFATEDHSSRRRVHGNLRAFGRTSNANRKWN